MSIEVKVECLKEDEEGQCNEELTLNVTYEPPEYEMGYLRLAGGFYVEENVICPRHGLTAEEEQSIIDRAIANAISKVEDEYDGPDCDDWENR